ncbi:MAG: IS3 family transposase [Actinomycetota bacterium]|nr:IS3 family transposase [Actinomycetota bacterium]
MSRYRHVSAMKADGFPVRAACAAAEVSTSAYYAWLERSTAPTEAEWDEALLVNEMVDVHAESDATYGSPRMTPELRRHGFCANHKRVERLMREYGIVGVTPRRSVRTTIRDDLAPPLPDLIGQDFSPGAPNKRYCGDITYVPTGEGWLYLATVLDLGSRRLAGWAMADHMRSKLVEDAIDRALELRGCRAGATFHSDRGAQNLSGSYWAHCELLGVTQSAGRVATCFDNSAAESFFSSLKRELVHRYRFATRSDAIAAITAWINRYNTVRLHSTIGYVPPVEWELHYHRQELQTA